MPRIDNAIPTAPLADTRAANDRDERRRRRDEQRGIASARAGNALDEEYLIKPVAQRAEHEQRDRVAPARPAASLEVEQSCGQLRDDDQRHCGKSDAHAIERERIHDGGAEFHRRIIDAPDERHEQ